MDSLYSNPLSLVIGAVTGVVISFYVAFSAQEPALEAVAVALAAVVAFRFAIVVAHRFSNRDETRTLELLFEIGAFAYALTVGAMAAFAIFTNADLLAQMVLTVYAVGYATAIAPRNAGRPVIALGQMVMVLGPISIALLMSEASLAQALGIVALLHIPSVITITVKVYRALRSQIVSAQANADLADEMQTLARTDVVTGLANRAGLNHAVSEELASAEEDARLALIWIDLDRFKEVNDLLGHPVGDKVLKGVAERLVEVSPDGSTVARFGGDEFIVFCPVDDVKHAELIASEIHCEIMCPMRVDGELLEIRASLGVALIPDSAIDADQLMQRADLALYHAKVGGRSQTCFYDPSMSRDLVRRREIEAELRTAIQRDELSIFFQPIVDLETSRIKTFEALVRWFHPEKGELRPNEFIPVAEETGVIVTLGNWITVQAARIAATWPDDVTVAVNLSPLQIRAPGAALGIKNALREAGLPPHRLELEVTESLFIEDNHSTSAFIEELSELGVRFALDDFGTGYSSLGYINKFPFSKIKVDRSFVSGAEVGKKSEAIIQAVAKMGTTLGMDIVAEGLETAEQVTAVRNAGCNLGQGYHFSRAVPDYLAAMLIAQERDNTPRRASA
ncbi:EAL domain-containing protein [uncultured Erythrobacter sp.]|uniref:putative bifunctional diguanylate cyclase/phosphodiesterase n=1 Tax=uncultured Erythrobacter sp. TaxID=263913 RepID=UPI002625D288|nr:EAL domain-containing protein [uncultured Erythrobacter sp.]